MSTHIYASILLIGGYLYWCACLLKHACMYSDINIYIN